MAEALGIAGSVAGLISLAAAIITQLDDLRGASDEVEHISYGVQSLSDVLGSVEGICNKYKERLEAKELTKTLDTYAKGCEQTLKRMNQILKVFASRGIKTARGRLEWARKKGKLRALNGRLTEGKVTLDLILTAINGVIVEGRDQADIKAMVTSLYQNSKPQFGRRGPSIHQRIEESIENDSVENDTTRSLTTDFQFAMNRFLDETPEQEEDVHDAVPVTVSEQPFAPLITPSSLLEAVQSQDVDRVKAILARDADISGRNAKGLTTLHYCAFHDDAEMAEVLLSHGADVDAKDGQSRSPLTTAVSCNAFEVAVVFLKHNCQIDNASLLLAQTRARVEDGTISQDYLVSLKPHLSVQDHGELLQSAILADDIQVLTLFLQSGFEAAGVDHVGLPFLFFALMHEKTATVRLLVDSGANVNRSVSAAVFRDSDPNIPRRHDVIAMEGGVLPLDVATRIFNCVNMTRLLLDLGADPNIRKQSPEGESILSYLCARHYVVVAEELIKRGADVTLPGAEGNSVIFWATYCGNRPLLKLLLANGGDTKARNKLGGGSPLMNAVFNRNDGLVRILLEGGADIEARCLAGKTPLILAVEMQDLRVMRTLLDAGADLNAKGTQGQTPDSVAKSRGNGQIIEFLRDARDHMAEADKQFVNPEGERYFFEEEGATAVPAA